MNFSKEEEDELNNSMEIRIWIGNIAVNASDADIKTLFEKFNPIKVIRQEFSLCGYIVFKNTNIARLAIEEFNGYDFKGKKLKLMF